MSDLFSGRQGGGAVGGLGGGLPNGVKLAAVALLIHQLMKHRQGGAAPQAEGSGGLGGLLGGLFGGGAAGTPASQPGGLGGILGGLLGAGAGGGAGGGLLGGLGGLLSGLRGQGLGQQVDSWVQPGANQPVSPQELERGFDPRELDEAAQRAGTDRGTLLQELSAMLPQAVDRMTPQGRMPQQEGDLGGGGLGGLIGSLLGQGPEPPRHR
ncbi:YidB family protein [Dankookia sp. P2]|uniref:YidB family protein n=1 Tax=Dankookia sp. P2 TaxID=3423955 RepID=UPI003D673C14